MVYGFVAGGIAARVPFIELEITYLEQDSRGKGRVSLTVGKPLLQKREKSNGCKNHCF
jgi:hypothetical protein